jgi:hypothetical protein
MSAIVEIGGKVIGSGGFVFKTAPGSALAITTTSPLPNATQGNAYTDTMAATGGTLPYTWSLTSQTGSNGWAVSSAGVVSGTPATAETDSLVIKVTDSVAATAQGTFNLQVQSAGVSPSAPQNLQLINQGGPNASQQGFYSTPVGYDNSGNESGSATGLGISANYQGFSWLPSTQGSGGAVTKYNIYRATYVNGVQGGWTLYDSVATPITITGYIAPTTDTLGQSVGLLTVTAVSGGTSSNAISDHKILCGLKLFSSAGGFLSGTKVVAYQTAGTGGGGTGAYYVDLSQTVGSVGSQQTFTGWAYNDTASTNSIPFNFSGCATVYAYSVTAVDVSANEGPKAYPTCYKYQGISMTGQANFSSGGTTTWNDTTGSPVNGPFDVKIVQTGGGFQFAPVWCGANGDANNHSYMCPTQHFECGAFNFYTFDIKPNDSTYNSAGPKMVFPKRSFGMFGGADVVDYFSLDVNPYCTPPLAAGQWSHCKIPFSALPYGFAFVTGHFNGIGLYEATFTVTTFSSLTCAGLSGTMQLTKSGGPTIPLNTFTSGSAGGGVSNWTDPQPPYTGGGPWVFNMYGPDTLGTENPGSGTYVYQGSSCYKEGFAPGITLSGTNGTIFLNNIGFATV